MHPVHAYLNHLTRRQFFAGSGLAMGGVALNLLAPRLRAAAPALNSAQPRVSMPTLPLVRIYRSARSAGVLHGGFWCRSLW